MSITDQIKNISESEKTPLVIILLETIQHQVEEIQHLKVAQHEVILEESVGTHSQV